MKLVTSRPVRGNPLAAEWLQPETETASAAFNVMKSVEAISETHDLELLSRISRRDAQALAELYDRLAGVLFSVAVKILRDATQAEEVLQEVFLQIWERASVFDPHLGKPLNWAITLTRNRSIDHLRGAQRRSRLIESVKEETAETILPGSHHDIISKETAALVRAALEQLSAEQRQAIELAFFAGLTQTEIATELKQPLGTIKARIRRGMLQLRESLENQL